MGIIEKLGMKIPNKLMSVGDVYKVYELAGLKRPLINDLNFDQAYILKKHLDDKNEMLEALIEVRNCGKDERMSNEYLDKIIEKIADMPWERIKELYYEK